MGTMIGRSARLLGAIALLMGMLLGLVAPTAVLAATDHVTNCNYGTPGSLVEIVAHAFLGDTIVFDLDCVGSTAIPMDEGLLIMKDLTIDGGGHTIVLTTGSASLVDFAVFVYPGHTVVLRRLSVSGSGATAIGNNGNLTLIGVTVANNRANPFFSRDGNAGGIVNATVGRDRVATLTVIDSTIADNRASDGPGGVSNLTGRATFINSTVTGNVATRDRDGTPRRGGGIFTVDLGRTTLVNTIVADNHADIGPDLTDNNDTPYPGTIVSGGHNLIGTTAGSVFVPATGDIVGRPALLGPLANNGGPTPTIAPASTSPAIGGGDLSVCAAASSSGAHGVDQRGLPRGTTSCDIGAVEAQIVRFHIVYKPDEPLHPGLPSPIRVTVIGEFGGELPNYTGTVSFTSSDPKALLPAVYTFTVGKGGDNGEHTFAVTFNTPGEQTITVTDVKGKVSGTSKPIRVEQGPPTTGQ